MYIADVDILRVFLLPDEPGDDQLDGISSTTHTAQLSDDILVPHVNHTLFVDLKKLVTFLEPTILCEIESVSEY